MAMAGSERRAGSTSGRPVSAQAEAEAQARAQAQASQVSQASLHDSSHAQEQERARAKSSQSHPSSTTVTQPSEATPPPPPPTTTTIPPLDPSLRSQIITHLLPPTPLPTPLLSRTLLTRHTFLPPHPSDIDAHLSPTSARITSPLQSHARLASPISPTLYAHDGEMPIARFTIGGDDDEYSSQDYPTSQDFPSTSASDYLGEKAPPVHAYMEHEAERGWVFRGADVHPDPFNWKNDVVHIHEEEAPGDYWAGFSPVSGGAELHDAEGDEDDYWAQYGAGVEPPTEERDEDEAPLREEVQTPPEEVSVLLGGLGLHAQPARHEFSGGSAGGGAAEASGSTSNANGGASASGSGSGSSPGSSILEQKVRGRIRAQLGKAWSAFAAGQDAEAAGFDWLRIGREIAERQWGEDAGVGDDVRTAVVKARLEAAKDIYELLGREGEGESFWRLVEGAIRSYAPTGEEQPLF